MLDPESVKQVFDIAGYSLMGLVGMFSAWQKMRAAAPFRSTPAPEHRHKHKRRMSAMERLTKVEDDLVALRSRQEELQRENVAQQDSMFKQQTAMFDLLVQQRTTLDKILNKMIGLI